MTSDHRSFNQEQAYHTFQNDIPQGEQSDLPLLGLHQALEQAGAYEKIRNERHRQVLQTYFTTELPMGDLREIARVKKPKDVGAIIHRSLQKAFPYLPQEVQEEYKSPKDAIRRKAGRLMPVSRERQREGHKEKRVIDKETGTFYPKHRQRISEGQRRRWQRYREQKAAEQTVVEFTEPSERRSDDT